VQRCAPAAGLGAIGDEREARGNVAAENTEIFARRDRRCLARDPDAPEGLAGGGNGQCYKPGVIDGGRELPGIAHDGAHHAVRATLGVREVGELRRCTEHHGHVPVVPARMHRARVARAVCPPGHLVKREAVQVRAQPDDAAAAAEGQRPHHASPGDARGYVEAESV